MSFQLEIRDKKSNPPPPPPKKKNKTFSRQGWVHETHIFLGRKRLFMVFLILCVLYLTQSP